MSFTSQCISGVQEIGMKETVLLALLFLNFNLFFVTVCRKSFPCTGLWVVLESTSWEIKQVKFIENKGFLDDFLLQNKKFHDVSTDDQSGLLSS